MKEYRSVIIDKNDVGIAQLQQSIVANGLQTAQSLGIQLAPGSVKLEHNLHVFLWDDSTEGQKGYVRLILAGNCFAVRVRWTKLTEPGVIFNGTLHGDGGHNGPPKGTSKNGAWAYKGNIDRKYCFIDGVDTDKKDGYDNWLTGKGWG